MDHITVRHIVEAVSGTLLCGDADTEVKHISIDSRSMRGADLFVPLIGEKSDAHRFLVQAMYHSAIKKHFPFLPISCIIESTRFCAGCCTDS